MKSYLGEDEDVRVEFSGDGREEFFGLNNHFDYDKITVSYQHFLNQQLFPERNINQEFLNDAMFDFNLQLIEKMTLRNGIERRLPFTDYELFSFRTTYTTYQQDVYMYLQNEGLSVVDSIYGHNQGSGFRYGEQAFFKKHIPKYSQYLKR